MEPILHHNNEKSSSDLMKKPSFDEWRARKLAGLTEPVRMTQSSMNTKHVWSAVKLIISQ